MIQIEHKKKEVRFEPNALKEFEEFPEIIQDEFGAMFIELEHQGQLKEPDAKKLTKDLIVYVYFEKKFICIVSCFLKKTQKTPKNILKLALKRFKRL